MIPKVIHYCWFGEKPIPKSVRQCINSWKRMCPDYEVKRWDESNFDVFSHPFMKAAYEAKAWAFVSDYARLKIIFENGGIYLDTDVELLKNLDFLLNNQCYVGVQQQGHLCNTGLGFGAIRHSPVVLKMLDTYNGLTFQSKSKESLACPFYNQAIVESFGYRFSNNIWKSDELTVYPPNYFDPISPGKTENLFCSDSISIHHYSASWRGPIHRFRRIIIEFVGIEKIHSIKKWLRKSNRHV